MSENVEELLSIREKTHGLYNRTAYYSQRMKDLFRAAKAYNTMDAVAAETLDMIAVKLARILCGDETAQEHWEDIEGYARLAYREQAQTPTATPRQDQQDQLKDAHASAHAVLSKYTA